ncbi:MAG: hypothetical protein Q8Q35_04500 [Nanoarchaeota archaeon]|nr:hypothetical protein [Nanoarchaeota archaeon]
MAEDFENIVKTSFKKVRDDILVLEKEILSNREFIIQQNSQIESQNAKILALQVELVKFYTSPEPKITTNLSPIIENTLKKEPKIGSSSLENDNSTGNIGVHSFSHSLDIHSSFSHSQPNYSLNMTKFREELPLILANVSRQEFLTFLTIYQQEESTGKSTYGSIANELNLSSGCVRSYVSALIKKGLPIVKVKYNNKIIILSIPNEIRGLNMKNQIVKLFYKMDPNQTKLGSDF